MKIVTGDNKKTHKNSSVLYPEIKEMINKIIKIDKREKISINQCSVELNYILDKIGIPTSYKIGKKQSEIFWMLVQHTGNKKLIEKMLNLVKKNVKYPSKLMNPTVNAYLTDRLQVLKKKPQVYGTQFRTKNGELIPYKICKRSELNKRRKKIGLKKYSYELKIWKNFKII